MRPKKKVQAVFYRAHSGRQPVREWLLAMNDEDRKAIGKDIQRLEFEWPLGMPICRAIGDDLWEVRSSLPRGRIASAVYDRRRRTSPAPWLHQEVPPREIELAKVRRKESIW